ncbi:uncharacterized protein TNCV_4995571 [Trichonephila clavipes]|nr:uncharacterized protein TNCV_4995571 [Trichonephila clavipes]
MMLELSSNDIPHVLNWRQSWGFRRSSQSLWDSHESTPAVRGNCSPDHDSRYRSSVSRQQTVWLQTFRWLPSDQHRAITGSKAKPAFIRKHNRSPLYLPMCSGFTRLASQTAMAWSQWNTRYRAPASELSMK